jgi:hypothetical protein
MGAHSDWQSQVLAVSAIPVAKTTANFVADKLAACSWASFASEGS